MGALLLAKQKKALLLVLAFFLAYVALKALLRTHDWRATIGLVISGLILIAAFPWWAGYKSRPMREGRLTLVDVILALAALLITAASLVCFGKAALG